MKRLEAKTPGRACLMATRTKLELAAKLAPKDVEALRALGRLYAEQLQYDKAVEAISRGLQPGRVAKVKRVDESQLLLGYSYYKLGRLDEARAAFTEAAKDPRAAELVKLWLAACVPPPAPVAPAEAAPAVVPAPAPAKP